MEGKTELTHGDTFLSVVESHALRSFFEGFFGQKVLTFDYKWLRGVHRQAFTGTHTDSVYMSRTS